MTRRAGRIRILAVLFVLALSLSQQQMASAQTLLDFDKWMQTIDRRSQSLQRALTQSDAVGAREDAQKIAELYAAMADFFTKGGYGSQSVRLSNEGHDLAACVLESLGHEDFGAASQAALSIGRGCRTCHTQFKPLE